MNDHTNPSASRLLRDATDDLAVDADRIVQGGIARGRTLQRRRRVGTTVAAAAVVGVIGVAASVGPGLLGDGPATGDGPGFAEGTTATSSPLASPPTEQPRFEPAPRQPDAAIKIGAELVPTIIGEKLGGDGEVGQILTGPPYGVVDEAERKIVHFLYDGTLTTFSIERADTLATCAELVDPADQPDGQPGGECVVIDGLETLSWGPDTADGVTGQGTMVWQHGYVVSALSYDAADGKDVEPVTDTPPISLDELIGLASDDVWFDVADEAQPGPPEAPTPAKIAVKAKDIPALVTAVVPGDVVPYEPYGGYIDAGSDVVAHFQLDGELVTAGISRTQGDDLMKRCNQDVRGTAGVCVNLPDGTVLGRVSDQGPQADGAVTSWSATHYVPGFTVSVLSYNSAAGKDSPVLSPEPPISWDQLVEIVTGDGWLTS